ncbi:MAG: putative Ig domain-containing protein, partial [Solirubrobacteraceae bacterium]
MIEVLLALVVLALAALALIIAFTTTIAASAQHRQLARNDTVLATASEETIAAIENKPTLFIDACSTPIVRYPFYSTNQGFPLPAPYTADALSGTPGYLVQYASTNPVEYWDGTAFTPTCVAGAPQLITITLVGTGYSNSFVVDYPVGTSGASLASGGADHLVFLRQPGCAEETCYAGSPLTQQPIVEVADSAGNPVTTDLSPVILQISANSPSTGVLSGCQGNEVLGVVTFTGCTLGSGGNYILTASDGSLTPVDSEAFTVAVAPFQLVFTTQPVAAAAGSPFSSAPTVAVENVANGQVNPAWQGTITLTSSGGAFTGCSNATTSTTVTIVVTNGAATMPTSCRFWGGYFYNPASSPPTTATNYTMTAVANPTSQSDAALPATSNAYFVTGPGPASQLSFKTSPTGVASNSPTSVFPVQPVVQVEDWFGNVAINSSPTLGLAFTGSAETLGGCGYSVSHGTYTYSGCHGSAYGNGLTLVASGSGLASATSSKFNITGVATQLVFTTSPQAGASGSSFPVQPVLAYEDASGNVVTAATATVALSVSPSSGWLANCTNLVPNLGYVDVQNCTFAGLVGTQYTMTATGGGLTSPPSAPFSPTGPGPATQLAYAQQPAAGAADALLTTQPVVVIEDSAGNVVTSSTNVITLTSSGSGVIANCAGLTAIGGTATVTNCTFGGVVGTPYTITASSGNLTPAVSQPISPTGPGPMSAISLVATTSDFTVSTSSTLTATLTDNFGNVETTDSATLVTFSSLASSTGSVTGLTAQNDTSGVAVDAVTGASAGTVSVEASANGVTSNVVTLTVNALPSITTTSLASIDDTETTYHEPVTASGGTAPLSWAATGFPANSTLSINASTGVISESGTNTASPGSYSVAVTVTDADGVTASQTFTLVVNAAPTLSPRSGALAAATDGQANYSQAITASGGTGSFSNWTVTSGARPAG